MDLHRFLVWPRFFRCCKKGGKGEIFQTVFSSFLFFMNPKKLWNHFSDSIRFVARSRKTGSRQVWKGGKQEAITRAFLNSPQETIISLTAANTLHAWDSLFFFLRRIVFNYKHLLQYREQKLLFFQGTPATATAATPSHETATCDRPPRGGTFAGATSSIKERLWSAEECSITNKRIDFANLRDIDVIE